MINDHTLQRFEPFGTIGLVKPIYADYSFANIPATVHRMLTGETIGPLIPADAFGGTYPSPETVVLVFVDSFGWQFWQRYLDQSRILREVADRGYLTPISALFPSTTSASVTTLNLGVLPARHGILEWNLYVPALGEVIQSLPFARLNGPPGSAGLDARSLFASPITTAHRRLADHGVASVQIASRAYAGSPYNVLASDGAKIIPYGTLAEALVALDEVLANAKGKTFVNFYWAGLDTAAHIHGPGSVTHDTEILAFWSQLDRLLGRRQKPGTLWLFTADHGHVAVPSRETLAVNRRWPVLANWLSRSPRGDPIWPCGSPRDMFLHIVPERRAEALALLGDGLAGIADVSTVDDAIAAGLFGTTDLSSEVRARLGDILVLPRLDAFVWWHEPGLVENRMNGHHGGLTPEEMITVLGVVDRL